MINVMIIDDNEALRLGLSIFVEEESDMRVLGEFVSAAASLSEVEGLKPDVVLLSVGLPDMTGFEACRKILNLAPSTRIFFIGPGHVKQVMIAGMLAGGSGYLTNDAPRADVVRTVRSNGHGEMFLVPEADERALWIAQNFRKFVDVGRLSEREKQVLSMVATGLSNADIGTELGISPNTVRNHIKRIFAKLNLSTKGELGDYADLIGVLAEGDFA